MSEGVARGVVNVLQLEAVVTGVLSCALRQNRPDQHHRHGEVHFVNHAGKLNLPLNNMRKWALERTADGYIDFADVDLDEIPLEEWIRRANELGMHPTMAALLTTFARDGEVEFPTIAKVQDTEKDYDQLESTSAS
jgi:hybrid polyketide synthase/nonribosomal peptide synthetase ACE1